MTSTYWATIRDDAPDWVAERWPEENVTSWDDRGPVDVNNLPPNMLPHVDRWELAASIDHGLRAADETMVTECAYMGAIIMGPVLSAMIGWDVRYVIDPYTAACEAVDYSGDGWAEDPEGSEHITWLHDDIVFYRNYDQCPDVMVESSADAGMTWFLVKVVES